MNSKLIPCFFFLLAFITALAQSPAAINIGFIMDLTTPVGRGTLTSVTLALSDLSAARPQSKPSILLLPRHAPRADPIAAASAALDLLSNHNTAAILGPQTSASAVFVADLGARAASPIVSFSATSPSISPSLSPFFIRASPSDASMGPVIAALAVNFGWRRIVPIYEDSDFGSSLLPNLVDAFWTSGDIRIPYRSPIPVSASDDRIREEMYKLKTLQTRVFILHAPSVLAGKILSAATEAGMTGEEYAWILTAAVAGQIGSINPTIVMDSMQKFDGVVGDVTITWNRSEYADFTFPYTISGVSMVVPVRDARSHRAWIFLDPLVGCGSHPRQ